MLNNFLKQFSPQMQQSFQSLQQQAMQSGNPQQFLMQKFNNDPLFQQGWQIFNEQGIQGLQNFIASNLNR